MKPSHASRVALSGVATLWWVCFHLPAVSLRYYGELAFKRAYFALFVRKRRERQLQSVVAQAMVRDFRAAEISVTPGFVGAEALRATNELLDRHGIREAVRTRKAESRDDSPRDYFHLSQETFPRDMVAQLLGEILPADLQPALELAHGRRLRCLKVSYHETDPTDPTVRVGGSLYNGHPFHIDGNPKFAKALLYLTDVDDDAGPFELFRHSRFRWLDELLRLAYQKKLFRVGGLHRIGLGLREHLPAFLARDTHLWTYDLDALRVRFPDALFRAIGPAGSFVFFNGGNLHNGSRDQKKRREVLHFIFV